MYVQVEKIPQICMYVNKKRYLTKYIYVCLGSKIPQICMYVNKSTLHKIYIYVCLGSKMPQICMYVAKRYLTKYIYVCLGRKIPWICMYTAKIPHKTYICMFRQQDTLDMHVYSKNTSQKYTHVQLAKYLMKKKQKQTRKRNKQMKKKREKRKISCLAKKPTCL